MLIFDPLLIPLQGAHLIEASAGTGKTYAITSLYLRLLLERRLSVSQILVVTFTEAATAELKERVRNRICQALEALDLMERGETVGDPVLVELLRGDRAQVRLHLRVALNGFDEAAIFTIHGFCLRMLRDSAFESGLAFDANLITSQQPLIQTLVSDFWVRERHDRYAFEVQHLDKKLSRSALQRLAAQAADNPEIPLVHEAEQPRQTREMVELHQAHFLRLKEMWLETGAEVRDLLDRAAQAKSIKGYTANNLEKWLPPLQAFFAAEQLTSIFVPQYFEKFTPGQMVPNKGGTVPRHVFFEACQTFLESHQKLEACLDQLVESLKLALVREVWTRLPAYKEADNQLCFQDLLYYLDRALRAPSGAELAHLIRRRFPAALIDEFQDTDEVQYRIFRTLFLGEGRTLFLIGDPKQAIYGFRGADIFTYLSAARDIANRYSMHVNWRSDPGLIDAFNRLFLDHTDPFLLEGIGYPEVSARPGGSDGFVQQDEEAAPLTFVQVHAPDQDKISVDLVPGVLAARISNLLASGAKIEGVALEPGHIAVLVRTNAHAQNVRDALAEYGIPCVLHGNISVFQTPEALELKRVLTAVAEPNRARLVKVALCTQLMGVSANDLIAMEGEPIIWERHVKHFRNWRELWQNVGFIQMFRSLIYEAEVQRRVFATRDGERAMTNLLHLAELLQEASKREHLGPAGLLTWFAQQQDVALAEEVAYELRLESDAQAVAVVTVHRSKGLEYPLVFCPYLWEPVRQKSKEQSLLYHDPERAVRVLDLREQDNAAAIAQASREEFAERLRLLYVALTRSRHYVEIIWGAFQECGKSSLAYLLFGQEGERSREGLRDLHKDEQLIQRLAQRIAKGGRNMRLVEVDADLAGTPWSRQAEKPTLRMPIARRRLPPSRRNTSFSQLTAHYHEPELLPVRDYDAFVADRLPSLLPDGAETPIPLRDFPKGARAGTFFHSVLEHLDFTQTDEARIERQIELELRKSGFETRWLKTLTPVLRRILSTPLEHSATGAESLRLECIGRSDRLDELEFLFPITTESGTSAGQLNAKQLGELFASDRENFPPNYPEQVGELGFAPIRGYMKGFIDLIFRYEERWYLVDYKSNYLGPSFADYAAHKLPAAMAESHYYLQYHIYSVALHRYLSHRIRNYNYERHFGGVYYLFIKGMDPSLGADYGIFQDKPKRETIESLSKILDPNWTNRPS